MEKSISNQYNQLFETMKLSKKRSELIKGGATGAESRAGNIATKLSDNAAICVFQDCNQNCNTRCTICVTVCTTRCLTGICVGSITW